MSYLIGPAVAPAALETLRIGYGALLFLTLIQALPQARRFFLSERWRGYADSSPWSLLLHNPVAMPIAMTMWFLSALGLILGEHVVIAAFANLLLCRYFFISMRWKSVLRGMGAPGFLSYWSAAAIFFLEFGSRLDPSGSLLLAATNAFRIDLGIIMICAGAYKAVAGYPQNQGMELGMINPFWGYWGSVYRHLPPSHWLLRLLNHLAYGTEIVAGILMLFPATQILGGLLILLSFAWIATHIRLGYLCEMVMMSTLIYIPQGHLLAEWLPASGTSGAEGAAPGWLIAGLSGFLWTYVLLLPLAKAGQWFNFLARKRLPGVLQTILERYTNFFGIIIWRVFSVDVTNFYIKTSTEDAAGVRTAYWPRRDFWAFLRYWHVGECICVTSLFTTLKYYASNDALFKQRVLRYARTVPCPKGGKVVFEYVAMTKRNDVFGESKVAVFLVDPESGELTHTLLDPEFDLNAASPVSPVHEGMTPGSYAPKAT